MDDTIDVHYASLKRACCYGGYHYLGHMVESGGGEGVEVFAPCCRCRAAAKVSS